MTTYAEKCYTHVKRFSYASVAHDEHSCCLVLVIFNRFRYQVLTLTLYSETGSLLLVMKKVSLELVMCSRHQYSIRLRGIKVIHQNYRRGTKETRAVRAKRQNQPFPYENFYRYHVDKSGLYFVKMIWNRHDGDLYRIYHVLISCDVN